MIQTFQPSHGFSGTAGSGGAATIAVNDTSDSAIGTQSVKIVTSRTGTQSNVYRFNMPTPVDMTGKQFAILLKCDDPTNLKTLSLLQNHQDGPLSDTALRFRKTLRDNLYLRRVEQK